MNQKTLVLVLFSLSTLVGCAHRPNLQYDCELVGKEPKNGKMLSSCD